MKDVSPWIERWSHLIAARGRVLDVACGSGRHVRWFASQGFDVVALDRDAAALSTLGDVASEIVEADIESGPWPLAGRRFDAVVVTNYLHRPLMATLVDSLDRGGVFIYETFSRGQASVGKPSNPAFLLEPGELLSAVQPLRIVAYEDGFEDCFKDGPRYAGSTGRYVQRIVAVRAPDTPSGASPQFPRYPLGLVPAASG